MLTAHSAGLISLLMLCESRLINTHLWQISTANCDRHSASSRYLIISAWRTRSKQRSLSVSGLPLALSLTHTHTHMHCAVHKYMMLLLFCVRDLWDCWGYLQLLAGSSHVLIAANRRFAASDVQTVVFERCLFEADGAELLSFHKRADQTHRRDLLIATLDLKYKLSQQMALCWWWLCLGKIKWSKDFSFLCQHNAPLARCKTEYSLWNTIFFLYVRNNNVDRKFTVEES